MTSLFHTLMLYLQYLFVRRAIIVGILIALCASLLGVTLVLKQFSFIGDGLSHAAFGTMCFASILHLANDMLLILPITIICAVVLLNRERKAKLRADAAVAILSVSALAIGYLLMNIFSASANVSGDVCTSLFGSTSILTLSDSQVWLSIFLSLFVIVISIVFYNKIFAVTFDESFSKATGLPVKKYNFMIAVVIAIIIVLAMNLVGSLLISALIIFPALSAMHIFKNYRSVVLCSALLSVTCAALGILIAIVAGTPVGSTIVACDLFAFLITYILGGIQHA